MTLFRINRDDLKILRHISCISGLLNPKYSNPLLVSRGRDTVHRNIRVMMSQVLLMFPLQQPVAHVHLHMMASPLRVTRLEHSLLVNSCLW